MCKAHRKVTHIKQQKYFHHLKGRGYNNNSVLYPGRLRWWKYFCCFICHFPMGLTHCYKTTVFFYIYNGKSWTIQFLLQPVQGCRLQVSGVAVSLLVSGLDILSTVCGVFVVHCVKLMLVFLTWGFTVWLFCWLPKCNLSAMFIRYGHSHYAAKVEDKIIGRLAVFS